MTNFNVSLSAINSDGTLNGKDLISGIMTSPDPAWMDMLLRGEFPRGPIMAALNAHNCSGHGTCDEELSIQLDFENRKAPPGGDNVTVTLRLEGSGCINTARDCEFEETWA